MSEQIKFKLVLDGKEFITTADLSDEAIDRLNASMNRLNTTKKTTISTTDTLVTSLGRMALGYFALERVISGVSQAISHGIEEAVEYDRALASASAAAERYGISQATLLSAVTDLTQDGLLDQAEALQSLRNLLQAGFGLSESVTLLKQFRDLALVNGKGARDLGDSLNLATEAIKNGNARQLTAIGLGAKITQVLKEQGVEEMDLASVRNNAALRLAVMNGVAEEHLIIADKAVERMNDWDVQTGKLSTAYDGLTEAIGKLFTHSEDGVSALKTLTDNLDKLAVVVEKIGSIEIPEWIKFAYKYFTPAGWYVMAFQSSLDSLSETEKDQETRMQIGTRLAQDYYEAHTKGTPVIIDTTEKTKDQSKALQEYLLKLREVIEGEKLRRVPKAGLPPVPIDPDVEREKNAADAKLEIFKAEKEAEQRVEEAAHNQSIQRGQTSLEEEKRMSDAFGNYTANTIESAFLQATERGRMNWRGFINDLIRMLAASGLKQMILALFNISTGGGALGFIGKLFGSAKGTVVNDPMITLVGEDGPEIIAPVPDFNTFVKDIVSAVRGGPLVPMPSTSVINQISQATVDTDRIERAVKVMSLDIRNAIENNRPVFAGDLNDKAVFERQEIESNRRRRISL